MDDGKQNDRGKKSEKIRGRRELNPGPSRDRRRYSPLYYDRYVYSLLCSYSMFSSNSIFYVNDIACVMCDLCISIIEIEIKL